MARLGPHSAKMKLSRMNASLLLLLLSSHSATTLSLFLTLTPFTLIDRIQLGIMRC